jgi:hypothetical protein
MAYSPGWWAGQRNSYSPSEPSSSVRNLKGAGPSRGILSSHLLRYGKHCYNCKQKVQPILTIEDGTPGRFVPGCKDDCGSRNCASVVKHHRFPIVPETCRSRRRNNIYLPRIRKRVETSLTGYPFIVRARIPEYRMSAAEWRVIRKTQYVFLRHHESKSLFRNGLNVNIYRIPCQSLPKTAHDYPAQPSCMQEAPG